MKDFELYHERRQVAKENISYDRIEKYIEYVLHDLETYENALEKFKRENRSEDSINGMQYKIDYAKYVLGLIEYKPNYQDYKSSISFKR